MLRILISKKYIPKELHWKIKKILNSLNDDGIEFPVWEKDFSRIEKKSSICINVFCYENRLTFPIYISDQRFENSMDLLLVIDDDKSHYVHINILTYLYFTKRKIKTKKTFVRAVYSVLVAKICWQNIKKFVWALMVHNLSD